jgi:hypothetical protein
MKEKKLGYLWLYADPNITFLVKSLFVNEIVFQEQIFLIKRTVLYNFRTFFMMFLFFFLLLIFVLVSEKLHRTRIHKCAMKKFGINGQMGNKLFLIFIYCFSLVKTAMNAARVCKLRNVVNKTPVGILSI